MSLSSRINEIRKSKNLSIDELCEHSGIPKGTLSKITAGITTSPTLDTVRAIANALNCTLDDLDDKSLESKKSPGGFGSAQGEPPQAGSFPESAIADQIKSVYGETVSDTFSMYVLLDAGDQGEIRGEIKQMLKQSKYLKQEGNLA